MNLVNKPVEHEVYGEGTICAYDENVVSVRFGSGVKRFVFPDAFRNYLVLTDKKSRNYVGGILNEIDEEMKSKIEQSILAAEKKQLLKRLPTSSTSQAAFGFIENDREKVLDSWTIFAGNYRSGYNRGKPRTPSRISPNSACLLTCRDEDALEEKRYIFGVFMVEEDFFGSECSDGIVPAHNKYRIILNDEESKEFLFWKYFDPGDKGKKWGSVEVKHFSNSTMATILYDILLTKRNTDEQKLCQEFFDYYCKLNKINKKKIPGFAED